MNAKCERCGEWIKRYETEDWGHVTIDADERSTGDVALVYVPAGNRTIAVVGRETFLGVPLPVSPRYKLHRCP